MLRHKPILAPEIYEALLPGMKKIVDGTFGHGGHTEFILSHREKMSPVGVARNKIFDETNIIAFDRDLNVASKGLEFTSSYKDKITFVHQSYAEIEKVLEELGVGEVDFILLDLGANMEHFKDGERGFSIKTSGPLDMRFDQNQSMTAADYLNKIPLMTIKNDLMQYGDFSEKKSLWMAESIVTQRKKKLFSTTGELSEFLFGIHCNAKVQAVIFQVIRIAVNKELEQVEKFLAVLPKVLAPHGRCAILTFHSIEDRIVKNAFKMLAEEQNWKLITKKVIKPSYQETQKNSAAKPAKLRIIER
ncbi:MAG TPA: 16S rRNA (cytosine(1402)-N(4))-methyltransferase RsmH [Candidatus Absconditabacterales bacterium]|nr:16S rRNA (cytosine(1402)-N(4))-methyltransferase RsmH [Candidatus Absconditabacterales bacterium]